MNAGEHLPLHGEAPTQFTPAPPRPPRRSAFVLAGLAAAGLLAWGAYGHWREDRAAAATQEQLADFVPTLRVAVAKRLNTPLSLTLPGTAMSFDEAHILARATGYIAERRVDIGSRVHQGDLLLRIAAPDLDQQLAQAEAQLGQTQAALGQARATLEQARANTALADVTNARTSRLAQQGWETQQNADNTRLGLAGKRADLVNTAAGVQVAEANLRAQLATVQRLRQLTAYERVEAPFDGVVTARNVDTGDLVKADASTDTPLLTLQRDDVLRVQVSVPQSGAVGLHDGLEATVRVPEMPSRVFTGRVARSAVALDPTSRTLLTQVDIPNPDHVLRPGLYVSVEFAIPRAAPAMLIPAEALLFNGKGVRVAMVGTDGRVHMRDVTVARDLGTTLELRDGLHEGDRVALSPPADLEDGQAVKVVAEK